MIMNRQAETMAWLLSRLDSESYDEVTGWQRDIADLDYEGTTRDGRSTAPVLAEPADVPGALELGAWLQDAANAASTVEVPVRLLRDLADRLDTYAHSGAHTQAEWQARAGAVEGVLRDLATQPEQRLAAESKGVQDVVAGRRQPGCGMESPAGDVSTPDDGGFLPGTACTPPSLSRLTNEAWRRERELRRNT